MRAIPGIMLLLSSTFLFGLNLPGPVTLQVLGPLPLPPSTGEGALAPGVDQSLELLPEGFQQGDLPVELALAEPLVWREENLDEEGCFIPREKGIYWASADFGLSRWTELKLKPDDPEGVKIWFDGKTAKKNSAVFSAELIRGRHRILLRSNVEDRLCLDFSSPLNPGISWEPPAEVPMSSMEIGGKIRRIARIATSDTGLHARSLRWRKAGKKVYETAILNSDGSVHQLLPASSLAPEFFAPESGELLLSDSGKKGTSLWLLSQNGSSLREICREEKGMVFARFSPSGRNLLIVSSQGLKEEKEKTAAPKRRKALREKLSDFQVRRRVFLLDIETGLRRVLLPAGDWIIDDVRFLPSGREIVYVKTLPRDQRPWFESEFHRLNLSSGEDVVISRFSGGWEGRPATLSPAPDGLRLAFVGPPEEVGPGHGEHNVYNRALWVLEMKDGSFRRISSVDGPAITLGSQEFINWGGKGILAALSMGSESGLGIFREKEGNWSLKEIPLGCELISSLSLSPDASKLGFIGSGRERFSFLAQVDLESYEVRKVEEPNEDQASEYLLVGARDESFEGPGGEMIDAWSYPAQEPVDTESRPLIVYYYGGAVPTGKGFALEHQVLCANGYELLIINPRGALGYGDSFADQHVRDWGPKASADILAGVDHFLKAHPEVDSEKIGIYGGSYGGFMTEYLISHSTRFAAAVSMYGISDIASYWGAGTWGYTYGDTALAGAFPWNEPDLFAGNSPLYHADKIRTPLLLLHGEADVNVPFGESEQLYTALKSLGREVELVSFPGEDHGISGKWDNRIQHRRMMLEFFDAHLKGQPEAWEKRWKKN